jgi:hypothetical protein
MGEEEGRSHPTGESDGSASDIDQTAETDSQDPHRLVDVAPQMESEELDRVLVGDVVGRVRRLASLGVSGAVSGSRTAAGIGRKLAGRGVQEAETRPGETP